MFIFYAPVAKALLLGENDRKRFLRSFMRPTEVPIYLRRICLGRIL